MKVVKAECSDCRGTGLYQGFCEGDSEAVVCLGCNGSGCKEIHYTPYTGRKRKKGVKMVRVSAGRFLVTGVGGTGDAMSYQDFLKRFPEAQV